MINLKQIMELFNGMKEKLTIRQDIERLNQLDFTDFIEWINKLKEQYIDEAETQDFYKYVKDNIDHIVCFE